MRHQREQRRPRTHGAIGAKITPSGPTKLRDCNNATVAVTAGQVCSQVLTSKQCSQTLAEDDSFIRLPLE
jgi:hypothetical protein